MARVIAILIAFSAAVSMAPAQSATTQPASQPTTRPALATRPYVYHPSPSNKAPKGGRASSVTGELIAIDLAAGQMTIRSENIERIGVPGEMMDSQVRLMPGTRLLVDNRPAEFSGLKAGDRIHAWLAKPSTDAAAAPVAESVYLLRGNRVGQKWPPELRHEPDATGCVFFDDFETGDLTRWQHVAGCAGILNQGALAGKHSFTATRRQRDAEENGHVYDFALAYGFPEMDDIWIEMKFLHTGIPADTQNFAILRPMPAQSSQVFAVRIVPPVRAGEGQWRLAFQAAIGFCPTGEINLTPGETHVLKIHWVRGSGLGSCDGTIQTWVDGKPDIQDIGTADTWSEKKFDRMYIGFMHTGSKGFEGTVVIDDLWIGDRDPSPSPAAATRPEGE